MKLPPERSRWYVRPMTRADLDAVQDIETRGHVEPWSKGIMGDCIDVGYTCLVVIEDEKIIAYTFVRIAGGETHILNICVEPKKQSQGLGQFLLNRIIEIAENMHSSRVILEVRLSNTAAIKLYEKRGFSRTGIRKDYYRLEDGREDAINYALELES